MSKYLSLRKRLASSMDCNGNQGKYVFRSLSLCILNKAYKSFSENLLNRSLSVSKVGVFVNPIFIPYEYYLLNSTSFFKSDIRLIFIYISISSDILSNRGILFYTFNIN